MIATPIHKAAVHSAGIAVITSQGTRTQAGPLRTRVGHGAIILIIAIDRIGHKNATQGGITAIIGTGITVRATQGLCAGLTCPGIAAITQGTCIVVVAGLVVRRIQAPCPKVTAIGGARIAIIAILEIARTTKRISTYIGKRTYITIVAWRVVW